MLPPLIARHPRSFDPRSKERGITLALVALAMFSIIAMAGLSIDVGTLYQASAEAQRAADSAALAAARVISMSGITGDPTNASGSWQLICKGSGTPATEAAVAVAQQNTVGGTAVPTPSISVTYSAGSAPGTTSPDCTSLGAGFGVNPVVTVKVTQASLPTYFSRIWGRTGSSVSATASAEAFNPSNSSAYASSGEMVPVQPRCVKPWMVPNLDPFHTLTGPTPCTTNCAPFVDLAAGAIQSPGVVPVGGTGVIGEKFWLVPDCAASGTCNPLPTAPEANKTIPGKTPNLEYLPGQASFASVAVPSDGSDACTAVASAGYYAQAIAGCDQSTQYQCGKAGLNTVDLSENPGLGDTMNGVQCLIHQSNTTGAAPSGQDSLLPLGSPTPTYPFEIEVGSSNPLAATGIGATDLITNSTSIVSVPIYDNTSVTISPPTTSVTIVGFLQVFIHRVDGSGNVHVTVMNVSGCSNGVPSGTQALFGTSPVPVRLITPP